MGLGLGIGLWFLLLAFFPLGSESSWRHGCDLAIGSCYVSAGRGLNLTYIGYLVNQTYQEVFPYNNKLSTADIRVNVSFPCDRLGDGAFSYRAISGDTYSRIASTVYANLTTVAALTADNTYKTNKISAGSDVNVTVNCSCENPGSVAAKYGFSLQKKDLLQNYNPDLDLR